MKSSIWEDQPIAGKYASSQISYTNSSIVKPRSTISSKFQPKCQYHNTINQHTWNQLQAKSSRVHEQMTSQQTQKTIQRLVIQFQRQHGVKPKVRINPNDPQDIILVGQIQDNQQIINNQKYVPYQNKNHLINSKIMPSINRQKIICKQPVIIKQHPLAIQQRKMNKQPVIIKRQPLAFYTTPPKIQNHPQHFQVKQPTQQNNIPQYPLKTPLKRILHNNLRPIKISNGINQQSEVSFRQRQIDTNYTTKFLPKFKKQQSNKYTIRQRLLPKLQQSIITNRIIPKVQIQRKQQYSQTNNQYQFEQKRKKKFKFQQFLKQTANKQVQSQNNRNCYCCFL